ncbi:uncharacterized protein V6R79_004749 [Siganus canaliculatus]
MMKLLRKKEALGTRYYAVFYAVVFLLVSEASSQTYEALQEEVSILRVQLSLMKNNYKNLCKQYSDVAASCSPQVKINCTECPDKWLNVGDQCFLLHTDRHTWQRSKQMCAEAGGHLAILTTKDQLDAVGEEGRRIGGTFSNYWIGLSDIETEGEWKWVDNSKLKAPTFWDALSSQPDNNPAVGEAGEDCAMVSTFSQTWNDVPCFIKYPRICQMNGTPLP